MATDETIHSQINSLVEEEHHLRRALTNGEITADEERDRLRQVEVQLDQCWDLLRQRDARREFGQDVDSAHARPADVVERYEG